MPTMKVLVQRNSELDLRALVGDWVPARQRHVLKILSIQWHIFQHASKFANRLSSCQAVSMKLAYSEKPDSLP